MFTIEFDHLVWLSQFYSEWRQTSKLVNLKISAKVLVCDFNQNSEMTKILNSVPLIKKTWGNHVYNWVRSLWLTLTVLHWMKTNFNISQFSRFLLRSLYVILVKIWKWLKLLNSFAFIQKTLVNHVHIGIWLFWLTYTVLQWMKINF